METVCLVGLPQAGKTTYLAALWEVVAHHETPGAISLVEMPVQREYLTEIHKVWVRCEPSVRTRDFGAVTDIHAVHTVDLALLSPEGSRFDLGIPDIPGEAFNEVWEERTWAPELRSRAAAATSIILFIHPGNVDYPIPIEKLRQVTRRLNEPDPDEINDESEDEEGDNEAKWEPKMAPTQVKLVDLLQSLLMLDPERKVVNLAVVISAWDVAEPDGLGPSEWLQVHLPLLWQFLSSTPERFPHRAFGVSAQGGDFSDTDDAKRLQEIQPPSQRVRIQEEGQSHRDITAPIKWLLNDR